jgi:acylphosphatase
MSEMPQVRLHALVEGRVQGVGFRAFVERQAAGLGVNGWVRNRWDESVEVVAEGERAVLEKLLVALSRGPSSAYVTKVTADWLPATGEFARFSVKSTW